MVIVVALTPIPTTIPNFNNQGSLRTGGWGQMLLSMWQLSSESVDVRQSRRDAREVSIWVRGWHDFISTSLS